MTYGTVGADAMATSDGYTVAGMYGYKNRLMNGGMGIWQRGAGPFTSGYTADRWTIAYGTSPSVSQSADVPSAEPFPYSLSVQGSNYVTIAQRIESKNAADLAGQNVTVSFWLKQTAGAGTDSMGVALYYPTAADNYTTQTLIGSIVYFTATSSWAKYTVTFTGLPANVANGLALQILAYNASSSTFLITGVQLEKGSTATSFDWREYGDELRMCQRYFCQFGGQAAFEPLGQGVCLSTTQFSFQLPLPVPMRVAPTGATVLNIANISGNYGTPTSIAFDTAGYSIAMLTATYASGLTTNAAARLFAGSSFAPRIQFSTEL